MILEKFNSYSILVGQFVFMSHKITQHNGLFIFATFVFQVTGLRESVRNLIAKRSDRLISKNHNIYIHYFFVHRRCILNIYLLDLSSIQSLQLFLTKSQPKFLPHFSSLAFE